MIYKFSAYGHKNITGTHKTTLEFTKKKNLSLKGDCIIGVNADFELEKLHRFLKRTHNNKISIIIKAILNNKTKIMDKIDAEVNTNFDCDNEFVVRKTGFISERTFAIKANNAALDLKRDLVRFLNGKKGKISIILEKR